MHSDARERQQISNGRMRQLGEQEQGGICQQGSEEQQHLGQLGGEEIQGPHQSEMEKRRRSNFERDEKQ